MNKKQWGNGGPTYESMNQSIHVCICSSESTLHSLQGCEGKIHPQDFPAQIHPQDFPARCQFFVYLLLGGPQDYTNHYQPPKDSVL